MRNPEELFARGRGGRSAAGFSMSSICSRMTMDGCSRSLEKDGELALWMPATRGEPSLGMRTLSFADERLAERSRLRFLGVVVWVLGFGLGVKVGAHRGAD